MKKRFLGVCLFLILLVGMTGSAGATIPQKFSNPSLVYVQLVTSADLDHFASTQLPMVAVLDGGLLSITDAAGQRALTEVGLRYQVLDADLQRGVYYQAQTLPSRLAPDYSDYGQVLLDLGSSVVLRMDSANIDALTQAGAELWAITLDPKPLPSAQVEQVFPDVVEPDPLIQSMINAVSTDQIYQYDRGLAGQVPVWVDDAWYTIPTRQTNSGTPIQNATHYVGQHLAGLGMDVDYHIWNNSTNPNVIGEIQGLVNPDDIFIIGGHIDDVTGTPGADDNASGSVAALIAADILSQYQWGCTLRFAVWTGEEQGLLGSRAYAQRSYQQGENILGYLNLDMIAWNKKNTPQTIYLGYGLAVSRSLELANLFADVVAAYNIDLLPTIGTQFLHNSDHGSFIDYGYPAILGIEGLDDFNPYYHGSNDTPANTDPDYFTDFVKASVATFAHMSNCLISDLGALNGYVTAAGSATPIQGVIVTADDGQQHSFSTTTDASGYYTFNLRSNTYVVTVDAYGYDPVTESNIPVTTGNITTQNFELTSLPNHVVSGTVTDSLTGVPLPSQLQFTDAPVPAVNTDENGFYSIEVAEGTWHLKATSAAHTPVTQEIVVSDDVSVNIDLDPLPCILLVDDDQDKPDVRNFYTSALNDLGYYFSVWNVNSDGDPDEEGLMDYQHVIWFTGYPYSNTFNNANEAAVKSYLDRGGNLFLSSQDYLYDMGMTPFAQNYLHISSFNNDQKQTNVTGINQFSDLGPYSLTYPFINYSDVVNPDSQGKVSFTGIKGNAAVSYDGTIFNTVFFGYPFESISSLPDRSAVMERIVNFFGGCEQPVSVTIEPPSQVQTSLPGSEVVYQFEVTNTGDYINNFSLSLGGIWPASLPGGDSTGPLSPGEAATVFVLVTVPGSMAEGGTDETTLTATSGLIRYAADSAKMTTRASFFIYPTFFPIISK